MEGGASPAQGHLRSVSMAMYLISLQDQKINSGHGTVGLLDPSVLLLGVTTLHFSAFYINLAILNCFLEDKWLNLPS